MGEARDAVTQPTTHITKDDPAPKPTELRLRNCGCTKWVGRDVFEQRDEHRQRHRDVSPHDECGKGVGGRSPGWVRERRAPARR